MQDNNNNNHPPLNGNQITILTGILNASALTRSHIKFTLCKTIMH